MSTHGFGAGDSPLRASGLSDANLWACGHVKPGTETPGIPLLASKYVVTCELPRAHDGEHRRYGYHWLNDGANRNDRAPVPLPEGAGTGCSEECPVDDNGYCRHADPALRVPEGAGEPTDGVSLIRAERLRQIEGASAEQDDALTEGQLAESAMLLIEYARGYDANWSGVLACAKKLAKRHQKDPARLLTVAGAFIAAEIDRLRRAAPDPGHQEQADG